MLFVVHRPRLERMIALTRDDGSPRDWRASSPYYRIEATEGIVRVAGLRTKAELPATVYEPGVLFLRITLFRRLLATFRGERFITIQATRDELHLGDVRIPLDSHDMKLFEDPSQAPKQYPVGFPSVEESDLPKSREPTLFDQEGS